MNWPKSKSAQFAALLVLVFWNALLQPSHYARGGGTFVGALASGFNRPLKTSYTPDTCDFFVRPQDAGWVVYDPLDLRNRIVLTEGLGVYVTLYYSYGRVGLWSPVLEICTSTVHFRSPIAPLTASQRLGIVTAIEAKHPGTFQAKAPTHFAAGGGVHWSILPLGVLNDLVVLTALVAITRLCISIFRRRVPVDQCPSCFYSLKGLAGSTCPECGSAFDAPSLAESGKPADLPKGR